MRGIDWFIIAIMGFIIGLIQGALDYPWWTSAISSGAFGFFYSLWRVTK
jgi:hypothetical protein